MVVYELFYKPEGSEIQIPLELYASHLAAVESVDIILQGMRDSIESDYYAKSADDCRGPAPNWKHALPSQCRNSDHIAIFAGNLYKHQPLAEYLECEIYAEQQRYEIKERKVHE